MGGYGSLGYGSRPTDLGPACFFPRVEHTHTHVYIVKFGLILFICIPPLNDTICDVIEAGRSVGNYTLTAQRPETTNLKALILMPSGCEIMAGGAICNLGLGCGFEKLRLVANFEAMGDGRCSMGDVPEPSGSSKSNPSSLEASRPRSASSVIAKRMQFVEL